MKHLHYAVIVAILLVAVLCGYPRAEAQQAPAAQRWEYARLLVYGVHMSITTPQVPAYVPVRGKPFSGALASMGADGWELVAVTHPENGDMANTEKAETQYIFKRPVR